MVLILGFLGHGVGLVHILVLSVGLVPHMVVLVVVFDANNSGFDHFDLRVLGLSVEHSVGHVHWFASDLDWKLETRSLSTRCQCQYWQGGPLWGRGMGAPYL